jgi:hypothetical protein
VLAVGGEDFDLGVVGSNIASVVFEPDEPAGEAVRGELLFSVEDANLEVFPEVGGADLEADGGAGAGAGGFGNRGRIGLREENFDVDDNGFILGAMLLRGLLGAVVHPLAGLLNEKGEGARNDGRDVRAGFGPGQKNGVAIQEPGHGLVVALAEEIGFADGLVGQGSVEAKVGGVKSVAAMRIAAMGGRTAK